MGELTQTLQQLAEFLRLHLPEAEIVHGYHGKERPLPIRRPVLTVGLDQVTAQPFGWGGRGEARKLQVLYRITICDPVSGQGCIALGEKAADLLLASKEFSVEEITWSEVKFKREAGGNLLTLKVRCGFLQCPAQEEAQPIKQLVVTAQPLGQ